MDGLNLDHDEARAVHRVVRAMHDGECPNCHKLHSSAAMQSGSGHECPSCGFTISSDESAAAMLEFARFMDRNLAVFWEWSWRRKQAAAQPEKGA